MKITLASLSVAMLIIPFTITAAETADTTKSQASEVSTDSTAVVDNENKQAVLEPIQGAFGILLGKHFEPSMVAKVLEEKPHTFPGPNGTKRQGSILRFEPSKADEHFHSYALKIDEEGIIYAIRGDYQFPVEQAKGKQVGIKKQRIVRKNCKDAVKALAKEIETRHGKPRGVGWDGEWYAFRQLSEDSDLSLRLYANRCRTGQYSIVYTDNKARMAGVLNKADN